ncbi:bifunctional diaminohydroxyphosphoribosylaminopyrimidine deaminase/5-amino-6-(5-phosphoribosylamino)uracil reductase RibD [Daejeonella sp.]|uniref:bifunctional diaminohydroxyphosphoribosylaminopyrimidine deaminase/5-amino-6-(5-phosphoribosylamino)uracil reductase RibD n=1 Tax=Daejeonella sp. TaxID=2805397 RepID=UPI00272F9F78|nr:bifunctional diaminohydroxyphosphoribosylaminopyrimidine deaminase/5-amino-6-(5-phosphoribosylamino)uracil reductase RibD [Daejeonella sp.]MDP2413631.1 bifunctional diaminohydroxyphosphoribosylaminopyrimidine deaminase/5-amino-6-(5-phosphoribosylamino)uracil reductase RibD [Daejeonella sp.]
MYSHQNYLQRCIDLARLGAGSVSPNPMVGSVIVCDDKIIGEGYHRVYGQAHAEVNAINQVFETHDNAKELLKRSTIYVNLEPCSHFGKTPPCADLIISNEIPRAVIGCRDPFDQINGKGIEKLRNAGIDVVEGVLTEQCIDLNKRFFTRIQKQRPYIILKWAQTSDGFFAPADKSQKWISSQNAKQLVHRWRTEEDAVLVGKNTALADNPRLNSREWPGRDPTRIVIDRRLELPEDLNVFDQSQDTIIFNEQKTDLVDRIKYLELEDFDNLLPQLIAYQLYLMDIQSLIVEGGAETLNLFIKAGLWDEARVFTSPQNWNSGIPAPKLFGKPGETQTVGPDALNIWFNKE